jgi:hypothetical protein
MVYAWKRQNQKKWIEVYNVKIVTCIKHFFKDNWSRGRFQIKIPSEMLGRALKQ